MTDDEKTALDRAIENELGLEHPTQAQQERDEKRKELQEAAAHSEFSEYETTEEADVLPDRDLNDFVPAEITERDERFGVKSHDKDGKEICGRWRGDEEYEYEYCHRIRGQGRGSDHSDGFCCDCSEGAAALGRSSSSMTHGLHMKNSAFVDKIPEEQQRYLAEIYRSYMEEAPFPYSNIAMSGEVWTLAVDRLKRLRLNDYLTHEGMIIDQEKIAPDGTITTETQEHPAMLAFHRLDRDNLRKMKKFGILDDITDAEQKVNEGMSVEVTIHDVAAGDADDGPVEVDSE